MPERDLYRVLGVSTRAAPGEIRRAYRRLAFTLHPDVGECPDPERFREVHEAYAILSDPDRRRSYDVESATRRRPLSAAEPLRPKPQVSVLDDFLTVRPSIEELLDHNSRNFFGYRENRRGRQHRLGVQAVLDADEARFGCRVPLRVPCHVRCKCGGSGEWWSLCPACYGWGIVESARELVLEIPPGTRDADQR